MTTNTYKSLKQAGLNIDAALNIIQWQEERITALENTIDALKAASTTAIQAAPKGVKERDYGPASQRKMTEGLAVRILVGRYSKWSVRKIADELGLSRGQVYSLKGGYTMKGAWKIAERIKERRAAKMAKRSAA